VVINYLVETNRDYAQVVEERNGGGNNNGWEGLTARDPGIFRLFDESGNSSLVVVMTERKGVKRRRG
jgi:hypothetical protein